MNIFDWQHKLAKLGVLTGGYVEAAAPLCYAGVLVAADGRAGVQHHAGALVGHAKLVGVHAHAGDARDGEVEGRHFVAGCARKGQHKAAQACVHVAAHPAPPCQLCMCRHKHPCETLVGFIHFTHAPKGN